MGSEHTVADDIVYDLISIQYHALKAAEVYDKFLARQRIRASIKTLPRSSDSARTRISSAPCVATSS